MPGEDLVSQLKDLQRKDAVGKEQWIKYCDSQGGGVRDPSKHNPQFVQQFFDNYSRGLRIESYEGEQQSAELAALVKEGQKKSKNWKAGWAAYCARFGGGINDPTKHDEKFLVKFLDFLGTQGNLALEGQGMMMSGMMMPGMMQGMMPSMGGMEPPAKRARISTAMVPAGMMQSNPMAFAGSGDPEKDNLVNRIKQHQRLGPDQKSQWWDYTDQNHGGVHDPNRHGVEVLRGFCQAYQVA